ncbi:hypothetical protein G6F58_013708 [Rhizopus delemar]|nr:hypothetical protein G6F58_013708 [Rhizopus delemar]
MAVRPGAMAAHRRARAVVAGWHPVGAGHANLAGAGTYRTPKPGPQRPVDQFLRTLRQPCLGRGAVPDAGPALLPEGRRRGRTNHGACCG